MTRRREGLLSLALLLALGTTIWPLATVIRPTGWLPSSMLLAAALVLAWGLARAVSRSAALGWLAVVAVTVTGVPITLATVSGEDASPWAHVTSIVSDVGTARSELVLGVAPMDPSGALARVLVWAIAILTLLLIAIVLHLRIALLGIILLTVLWVVPALATRTAPTPWQFATFTTVVLGLLIAQGASDPPERSADGRQPEPSRWSWPVRVLLACSVVVAVVAGAAASPLLPAGGGIADGRISAAGVDPTLRLGDQLRQQQDIEVLRVRTSEAAPYLRLTTVSDLSADSWDPDPDPGMSRSAFPDSPFEIDAPAEFESMPLLERTDTIELTGFIGPWLPLPYPAYAVDGLSGQWRANAGNRTLQETGQGLPETYRVSTMGPAPEALPVLDPDADTGRVDPLLLELPADSAALQQIAAVAAEVTAAESSDYRRLAALEDWFRTEFDYSLDAPVDGSFDGTNAEAVAQFLDVRAGYCVHFASAFALMARTLDMPSRVVIGYLPGTATGQTEADGDTRLFSVRSTQLHAWPEVHLAGVGWVPFEPTASLGVATGEVSPGENEQQESDAEAPQDEDPSAPEQTQPSAEASDQAEDLPEPGAGAADTASGSDLWPRLGWLLLTLLVLLLIPAAVRVAQRARRLASGSAAAAWHELRANLIDLDAPSPASSGTIRATRQLLLRHGAAPEDVDPLAAAAEAELYAPDPGPTRPADIRRWYRRAARAVRSSRPLRIRLRAVLVPASLLRGRGPVRAAFKGRSESG